jgi:hypothetical protein
MKKKTLLSLPPLQQDLIKATLGNPKLDSLVENIIKRKRAENLNKKKRFKDKNEK